MPRCGCLPARGRSGADPSTGRLLGAAPGTPLSTNVVHVHAFWRLLGDPQPALAWIEEHAPSGSHRNLSGESGNSFGPTATATFDGFGFPVVPGVVGSRELVVTVAPARGGGTALRADAESAWLARRTAAERIRDGVTAITISDRRLRGSSRGPWTVTGRRRVRRIVALVNALPLGAAGPIACPNDIGPYVALTFASGSRTVARLIADGSGCGFASLSIGGRQGPSLAGGAGLVKQLSSLLGISF